MGCTPKVSVIIPVYNVEKYLKECLDSIIGQTLEEIEIICVDDGSTDSSLSILQEYGKRDPRIIILTQENQGAGAARNKGLAIAKGEYLSFLDADDFFEKKMLQEIYQTALEVDADIVVYGADRYIQNEHRYVSVGSVNYKLLPSQKCFAASDIPKNIFRAVVGWTWDKLFKRSFIQECDLKFQEIRVHNDLLFTFAAWISAGKIIIKKDVFTHQRKRGGGSISDEFKEWWCTFDALYALKQYIEEHHLKERFFTDYINYAVYLMLYNSKRLDEKSYQNFCNYMKKDWMQQLGFFEVSDDIFYNQKELETCKQIMFSSEISGVKQYNKTMVEEIKVSVIVPMLNSIQYIDECIISILNQTLHEIEVICIDAGSNDGTLERLQYYANIDTRVKIINSNKKSYGYQVNLGLSVAKGKYFAIVESDDYIIEDMYETLYNLAVKYDLDSVKSDFCLFFGDGNDRSFTHRYLTQDRKYYDKVLAPDNDINLFRASNINPPGIYSLDFMRQYNIKLNETPGASFQDNGLWFQIFVHSKRMLFYPRPLYMIRRDNENSSVKSKSKIFCMCDEYDYIRRTLKTTDELERKYAPICALYRYHAYTFTLNRIAEEYKLSFLYKFSYDFSNLDSFGELKEELFSKQQWDIMHQIMRDPYQYYCARYIHNVTLPQTTSNLNTTESIQIKLLQEKLKAANSEIHAIHSSWTYRIGSFFTWLPRKIRGGIYCFQEHGLGYTMRRMLIHLHLTEDEYKSVSRKSASVTITKKPLEKKATQVKRDYDFYRLLPPEEYEAELVGWFKRVTGEDLHLNNPRTFNEKIQWLKLYDSTPIKTRLADKYLVRAWVEEKIGAEYLVPLLGVWDSFEEIDFDKLPGQFVLKANHGSGWNIIVTDKSKLDIEDSRKKFNVWLQKNYAFGYGLELHYMNIPSKIIAEKYIADLAEDIMDYRFFCFNGSVKYIWVDTGSGTKHHKRSIFDINWELQDYSVNYPNIEPMPPKPYKFDEMLEKAEILSKNFAFVRIDFYSTENQIYFGEITFTPQSGVGKWSDERQNQLYGDLIQLPSKSPLPKRLR